jgi:predicted ArsR family transcriptional regulator
LIELADLFDGPVEIVSSSPVELGPTGCTVNDEEILSYLRRRPTGIEDIASGLNVHRNEISKRLQALVDQDVITTVRRNGDVLFQMRSKDA